MKSYRELIPGGLEWPKPMSRYWHKADMLNALTNVRYRGKADIDQRLLLNVDL